MGSTTTVYGESSWAMAIAEAVDSSAGTAGDGINVTFTETTVTNKKIFLFSNKFTKQIKSKDKTEQMVKGRTRTTKLGTLAQTATISQALIPTKSVVDMNTLDQQLESWFLNGNAQAGTKAIYLVIKMPVSGNTRYKTFMNKGVTQNWLKCEIKSYKADMSNERLIVNLAFAESNN